MAGVLLSVMVVVEEKREMLMRVCFASLAVCSWILVGTVGAAVTSTTIHGPDAHSLDDQIAVGDLLAGLIPTELPGDNGWHPANPAASDSLHPDGLPAFTDDAGDLDGLTGLLNDFPGEGVPAKRVQYDLSEPADIARIQILSGNGGRDGRVFSTAVVSYSSDGVTFTQLGYFQSDPSGTLNNPNLPDPIGATMMAIFDDSGAALLTDVTNLQIELYAVDNTAGEMRDPFDGVNAFTSIDDGLSAAFVSPLIFEIDAVAVPEPAALVLLLIASGILTFWAGTAWAMRSRQKSRGYDV